VRGLGDPADSISTATICRAILIQTDIVSSSLIRRSLEAIAPVVASGGRGAPSLDFHVAEFA
jgi:hypothetical protein